MKNGKIREFLQQTMVKTGAVVVVSALVLTSSSWSNILKGNTQFVSEAELPVFVDLEGAVDIDPNKTPAGNAPKVTRTTKTTKSTKKVKLKEKSKKTYTKKSKAKKQTSTSQKVTGTETTTVTTETSTTLTSKFTKGSNINKQTTTVTTVTTTTVQSNEAAAAADGVVTVSEMTAAAPASVQTAAQTTAQAAPEAGQVSIGAIAPRVDSRVSNAYTTLGFTININPSVSYSGVFDARNKGITIKRSGDTIYHEIGHFVAFIAGNVDKSPAFQQVFEQEKNKYTMFNKAYVLQNSSEYFAESFKNYTLDPNELRSSRPLTFAAIESALNNITEAQVTRVQTVYRSVWEA